MWVDIGGWCLLLKQATCPHSRVHSVAHFICPLTPGGYDLWDGMSRGLLSSCLHFGHHTHKYARRHTHTPELHCLGTIIYLLYECLSWVNAKQVHERWGWECAESVHMRAKECVYATCHICTITTTLGVSRGLLVDQYWVFDLYLKPLQPKAKHKTNRGQSMEKLPSIYSLHCLKKRIIHIYIFIALRSQQLSINRFKMYPKHQWFLRKGILGHGWGILNDFKGYIVLILSIFISFLNIWLSSFHY